MTQFIQSIAEFTAGTSLLVYVFIFVIVINVNICVFWCFDACCTILWSPLRY